MTVESDHTNSHVNTVASTETTNADSAGELLAYLAYYITTDENKTRAREVDFFLDADEEGVSGEFGEKAVVTQEISDQLAVTIEAVVIDSEKKAEMTTENPSMAFRLTLHQPGEDPSYMSAKANPATTIARAYFEANEDTFNAHGEDQPTFLARIVQPDILVAQPASGHSSVTMHPILSFFTVNAESPEEIVEQKLSLSHLKAVKEVFAAPRPNRT